MWGFSYLFATIFGIENLAFLEYAFVEVVKQYSCYCQKGNYNTSCTMIL